MVLFYSHPAQIANYYFYLNYTFADTSTTEYFNDRATGDTSTAAAAAAIESNDDHFNVIVKPPAVQLRKSSIAKTYSIDQVDCKRNHNLIYI